MTAAAAATAAGSDTLGGGGCGRGSSGEGQQLLQQWQLPDVKLQLPTPPQCWGQPLAQIAPPSPPPVGGHSPVGINTLQQQQQMDGMFGGLAVAGDPLNPAAAISAVAADKEIPWSQLQFGHQIGEGGFGKVRGGAGRGGAGRGLLPWDLSQHWEQRHRGSTARVAALVYFGEGEGGQLTDWLQLVVLAGREGAAAWTSASAVLP
eukprot:gene13026-13155_t